MTAIFKIEKIANFKGLLIITILSINLYLRFIELINKNEDLFILVLLIGIFFIYYFFPPRFIGPILFYWGMSLPLYGSHSYSTNNRLFELLLSLITLLIIFVNSKSDTKFKVNRGVKHLIILFTLLSCLSLLSLPVANVLETFFLVNLKCFASLLLNAKPDSFYYAFAAANRLVLLAIFTLQISYMENREEIYRSLFNGIIAGCILAVIIGMLHHYNLMPLSWLRPDLYGVNRTRLQSTFGNPGWMAEYLIITIPFVIFRFFKRSKDFWEIFFLVFILLIFWFTLKLVAARTALISYPIILLLFGLTYYFIQNPNKFEWLNRKKNLFKALITVPLFFFVSILIAFYSLVTIDNERKTIKDTSSGIGIVHKLLLESRNAESLRLSKEQRIEIWRQALQFGKESPLFGMGYESYGWHVSVFNNLPDSNLVRSSMTDGLILDTTHNLFLQLFISGGVTALLLWIVVNGYAIMLLSYDLIYEKKLLFNVPVLISIIGFHLYGISQSMQYIPVIWFFIFLNLGYAMTISRDGQVSQRRKFWKLGHIISIILILSAGVAYSHNIGSKKFADKYGLKLYAEKQNRDNYIGFYDPEDWNGKIFRWSLNKGILKFSGNGTIDYSLKVLHPDINKKPVIISIYLDGKPVDRLSIWNPVSIRRQYFIPYSDKTNHELIFKVNRTWNPKKRGISKDNRELGVAVSDLYHLNETPKDGIGFYSFETWNGDNVPGWPENKEFKYRWTGQRASLNLQTEFKNGRSIFLMCARPTTRWFPTKVQLIGDSGVIKQFKITDMKWNQIALTPEEIGNSKVLTIQVDRTWNPKLSGISDDGRDLGVAVALLEEKS